MAPEAVLVPMLTGFWRVLDWVPGRFLVDFWVFFGCYMVVSLLDLRGRIWDLRTAFRTNV